MVQSNESEVAHLTRPECLELLSQISIGRVGASIDALPVILPVHFALFEDSVLFRTIPGTKFDAATIGAVVAFQADSYESFGGTGWSVLLQGIASVVTDEKDDCQAASVPIKPWTSVDRELHLVRVEATNVSGRRFHLASIIRPTPG
jgi:nitroimidazol reductase NimA-like FMN-containing flavoprotein (pyridoxamine 5'-phosphate oxidase superfamily)